SRVSLRLDHSSLLSREGLNTFMADKLETWDLCVPGPGATGLSFARARINAKDAGDRLLVHAAPQRLQLTVTDAAGQVVARSDRLERHQPGPMSFLLRHGATITLEDGWPTQADIGRVVLLPRSEEHTSELQSR